MNTIEKWVKALRSGKYKQSHGVLRSQEGWCCLGVLMDVAEEHVPLAENMKDIESLGDSFLYPAESFLKEVGVSYDDAVEFARMNDAGKTFKQIAKQIEKKLLNPPGNAL